MSDSSPDRSRPTVLAIFGAAGDLTGRKLVPALYNLFLENEISDRFVLLGLDAQKMSLAAFRRHLRGKVDTFSRRGKTRKADWERFEERIGGFLTGDFTGEEIYSELAARTGKVEKDWDVKADHAFYLAVPPELMEPITRGLGKAHLARDRERARIVVEKPFGHDLGSARSLNAMLTSVFQEQQIYRIDHYLGKETVQNILAFRFANALFEPIWDSRYIDHVQITVAESVGVEHRGGYYDHAGALRDMVQNHLFQVLCLVAMEAPVSFAADEVRGKKVDVLHALRPFRPEEIHRFAVRGQYGGGWIQGKKVDPYHAEPGVREKSPTETYAALKLFVDNWRWHGVPFYLRTGKRLAARVSEVSILFRPVPHQSFPASALEDWQPNRLIIRIQPEEGILWRIQAKRPGLDLRLSPVDMHFTYKEAFAEDPPTAYETLLRDVMRGDATLFMRADQVEAAWSALTPVLDVWDSVVPVDFPNYQAGSWGPEAADLLIAQDGRSWLLPTVAEEEAEEKMEG